MRVLERGERVGPYEIVAPLRTGGMAALYLGRRSGPAGFSMPVAIKIVHPHLASDGTFVQMFLDEARLAARISDPHVVRVEALGEADGLYYLAMEYVLGASLSDLVHSLRRAGRRFNPAVACAIAIEVADGLHAAHELKDDAGQSLEVVHRDVSPQNVIVSRAGHVKLIDFGVALSRSHLRQTEAGSLKGKLGYMSPEQAWGRPVDRRADVFSLGVVLWEMLTLQRLFRGANEIDTLELVRRAADALAPSTHAPDVSAAIDAVVMRALSTEASDRHPTTQALRLALIEACPDALHVHPEDLGALVEELEGESLAQEQSLLSPFGGEWSERTHADRPPVLERLTHESIAAPEELDEATKASRPSAIAATAPASAEHAEARPASPVRGAVGIGLGVAAAIGGVLFGLSLLEPGDAVEPAPGPDDLASAEVVGGCAAARRVEGVMGELVSLALDTRAEASVFALRSARNTAVAPAPEVVIEYRVPTGAPGSLALSTVNSGTDARFDTLLAVFRGPCDEAMYVAEPDVMLDDLGREFRASGAVAVEGGEAITLVVTGYGGDLSNRVDRGLVQLDAALGTGRPPRLEDVRALAAGPELILEVDGADPDGDAEGVAVRLFDADDAPLVLRLQASGELGQTHHGGELDESWLRARFLRSVDGAPSFRERATLFFDAAERVALRRVARAEVSLYDVAGRSSEARAVPVRFGEVVGPEGQCSGDRVCALELACGSRGVCVADHARAATCENATPLSLTRDAEGAFVASVQGIIDPGAGLFTAQCLRPWTQGVEDVYRVALPDGRWDIELTTDSEGTAGESRRNPDTVLYLRRRCLDSRIESAPDDWCNDDIRPGGGEEANQRSRVTLPGVEAPAIYAFVELWGSALPDSAGERYELSVRAIPSADP